MNQKVLIPLLLFVVLVGGGVIYQTTKASQPNPVEKPIDTAAGSVSYTLADVAQHNTETDCWLVIENKVYNVTPFIAFGKHPGGKAILQGCGKDATSLFVNKPNTGRPHSDRAREGLKNFYIGDLTLQ